jgi:hypothetical protein
MGAADDDQRLPAPAADSGLLLGASAVETKQALVEQRQVGARRLAAVQQEVEAARAEMERQRKELEQIFQAKRAELEQAIAPLRAELARVEEMAWTIDLYLGRDEQLRLLRDGAPAAAEEPITVRQMVLAMDEESLVLIGAGGLDGRSVEHFLEWLVEDDSHLDRVLPEQKSIVVLVPTRQRRDYGNAYEQAARDEENRVSHWLGRNGEKVYVLVANLDVGDRLLPVRSEFVDFFYARAVLGDGARKPMEPGSKEWLKAEKAADARHRHFMRIMLVLQGLVDRTVVFHPLPEGGVNFLSLESQDSGRVRLINELDSALESGRKPFTEWQKELNAQLRPGMRIIGKFGEQFSNANTAYDQGRRSGYKHSRLRPQTASRPVSLRVYLIEDRAPRGGLVIRYERTDFVNNDSGKAQVRASCVLYPSDGFILPFDLVTVAELQAYLYSRADRSGYLSMVPVLRAALEAKVAEQAEEAPFRLLLAGTLAREHGVEVADVEAALDELILHWKLANRWARPLVLDDPAEQNKAVAAISREWAARQRAVTGNAKKDAAALATAAALPDVIAVGRSRDGRYIAYAPSAPDQNVWLDEYQLTTTGKLSAVRRWVIPAGRSVAALIMLRTEPAWDEWNLRASRAEHISGPEAAEFAERCLFPNAPGPAIGLTLERGHSSNFTGVFRLYAWADTAGAPKTPDETVKAEDLLVVIAGRWKRDQRGQVIPVPTRAGYRWGNNGRDYYPSRSWWQEEAHHLDDDQLEMTPAQVKEHFTRHRTRSSSRTLVWLDDTEWAKVRTIIAARKARLAAEQKEESRLRTIEYAYTRALIALHEQERDEALRARFREDFGTDDDELWANHRKSLSIPPVHQKDTRDVIMQVLREGGQVAGRTLAQLAAGRKARHGDMKIPAEWADLVIPELPAEEELADAED